MTFEHELKQFKQLAQAAGWYFVGVQDPIIPELMPTLVLTRGNKTNFISFQPETFDPVQIAKTHLS